LKPKISAIERWQPPAEGGKAADSDEPILLAEQGVYLGPGRSSWQIGQLNLTADRLCFVQPRGVLFEMPLERLLAVAVERKHYVVVRKPALAVTFRDPRLRNPCTAWFLTPQLGQWLAHLSALPGVAAPCAGSTVELGRSGQAGGAGAGGQGGSSLQIGSLRPAASSAARTVGGAPSSTAAPRPAADGRVLRPPGGTPHSGAQPPLTPRDLERLSRQLDPVSRLILEHLAANSHATIRELADMLGAANDMEVLFCIRQDINPAAHALLGRPVLAFVESQQDEMTGEQVGYAWWLVGSRGRSPHWREIEAEVFDEGERILVVVELAGASADAIDCELEAERLTVRAVGEQRLWRSNVSLPAAVEPQSLTQQFTNGVLSIHLRKQTKEGMHDGE
jgi:hypothetical protein